MVPSTEELEARMRPGGFSRVGFLGPDERLGGVLAADEQLLETMGIGFEDSVAPLDRLLTAAERSPHRRVTVDGYTVLVDIKPGFQICPWAEDPHHGQCTAGQGVRHASVEWQVKNLKTGRELRGPGLIVHLVRDHHFFQGHGSPLRVDPTELAELFELAG